MYFQVRIELIIFIDASYTEKTATRNQICIPGVAAAALSAVVFARIRRSSLEVLLCGLSLFDVLVLLSTLLIYPAMNACQNEPKPDKSLVCHFFWRSTLIAYPFSLIAQAGSVWTCVMIACDRFIAVFFPIKKRVWATPTTSVIVICGVALFSVLFKLPAFFEIVLNESGQITPSSLRLDPTYQLIYMTYMYVICILLLPWIIIIVLNGIVIQKVREAYRTHEQLTNSKNRGRRDVDERKMTIMTVVMTGIFVLCNIPPAINNIIESCAPQYREKYRQRIPLSTLLVCVNSASNILIYCWFNRHFRRSVFGLCTSAADKRNYSQYIQGKKEVCGDASSITIRSHKLSTL
ncbi:Serpentine type 7TM GPCR chemoreceptor Srw [Parelaphostrongylus tenuis]|uniref:Serpentine type 7TM GPCR chemoreceptor Srw n=1 Tax=Parelaphostrongylus tenuis TaxID=148309 RepID=A0AAD5R9I6_PARTN|nr:Serpentine type 7TM GPCR chemoreceptor Srw [Parelaphostrongylus tenuis]